MSENGDLRERFGVSGLRLEGGRLVETGSRLTAGRRTATPDDEAIRVVLIESDAGNLAALRAAVGEFGGFVVAGEATRQEHGLREVMKARPGLVVIGLADPEATLALSERLADAYPEAEIVIAASDCSGNLVKRAMRAGAREFLARPPEPQEIREALDRLLHQRALAKTPHRATGEIIAVFGAKGGLGATFLAANLAVLMAGMSERRAAIVDLDLEVGDVATFLNMKAEHSILDLVDPQGGLDTTLVRSALAPHASGLMVLAQPEDAADADRIRAADVGQALSRLKTMFEYVVVDTNRRFDERTLEALDLADHILLLVSLDLPTIRNARRCLEVFRRLGHAERLKLILNRHRPSKGTERLERSFGFPIYWRLPDDYATAISSINAGVPATEVAADTELARGLKALAARLAGHSPSAAFKAPPARSRGGLLRRLLST
jgi:pilus assembly protein CpaE